MIFGKEKIELSSGWTDEMVVKVLPFPMSKYHSLSIQITTVIREFEVSLDGKLNKTEFTGILQPSYSYENIPKPNIGYENILKKVVVSIDTWCDWLHKINEGDEPNLGQIYFSERDGHYKNDRIPTIHISLRGGIEVNNKLCEVFEKQKLYGGEPTYIHLGIDTKKIKSQLLAKDLIDFSKKEDINYFEILSLRIVQTHQI